MTTHKDTKADPKTDHKHPKPESEAKAEQKHPTKHVQMQRGTDEVNHGGTSYPVPKDTGIVELPVEAAEHVLKTGGAIDLTPTQGSSEEMVEVRNIVSDDVVLSWNGEFYKASKDGTFSVPAAALDDILPHGFIPC